MSNILSRSAIRPPKFQLVEIPEWGDGALKVRCMSAGMVLQHREAPDSPDKERSMSIGAILACVLGEDDQPFFTSAAEVEALDLPIFTRLQTAIGELSTPDAKAIEKN